MKTITVTFKDTLVSTSAQAALWEFKKQLQAMLVTDNFSMFTFHDEDSPKEDMPHYEDVDAQITEMLDVIDVLRDKPFTLDRRMIAREILCSLILESDYDYKCEQ